MRSTILKLLIILFTLTLYSCEKECGDPSQFPSSFVFALHNSNGKDLIYALGVNPEEKISLLDENGNLVDIDIYRGKSSIDQILFGEVFFKYIDRLEIPNGEITKTFYLRLPDDLGNPNSDIDTLKFVYELVSKSSRCNPNAIGFTSFNVSYNDSTYSNEKAYIQSALFIKK